MENRLQQSAYLAGDNFSLADITLLAITDFAGWVEIKPLPTRPALSRWYEIVSARPSTSA
jgi:glutathione S-transferase